MMEEEKAAGTSKIEMEKKEEDEEPEIEYPGECRVLDIMRNKYFDAI